MKEMFCPNCCQNVATVPYYHDTTLVLLVLCGVIPGIVYYWLKRKRHCPLCFRDEDHLEPFRKTKDFE